jgi:hypothetical protein
MSASDRKNLVIGGCTLLQSLAATLNTSNSEEKIRQKKKNKEKKSMTCGSR